MTHPRRIISRNSTMLSSTSTKEEDRGSIVPTSVSSASCSSSSSSSSASCWVPISAVPLAVEVEVTEAPPPFSRRSSSTSEAISDRHSHSSSSSSLLTKRASSILEHDDDSDDDAATMTTSNNSIKNSLEMVASRVLLKNRRLRPSLIVTHHHSSNSTTTTASSSSPGGGSRLLLLKSLSPGRRGKNSNGGSRTSVPLGLRRRRRRGGGGNGHWGWGRGAVKNRDCEHSTTTTSPRRRSRPVSESRHDDCNDDCNHEEDEYSEADSDAFGLMKMDSREYITSQVDSSADPPVRTEERRMEERLVVVVLSSSPNEEGGVEACHDALEERRKHLRDEPSRRRSRNKSKRKSSDLVVSVVERSTMEQRPSTSTSKATRRTREATLDSRALTCDERKEEQKQEEGSIGEYIGDYIYSMVSSWTLDEDDEDDPISPASSSSRPPSPQFPPIPLSHSTSSNSLSPYLGHSLSFGSTFNSSTNSSRPPTPENIPAQSPQPPPLKKDQSFYDWSDFHTQTWSEVMKNTRAPQALAGLAVVATGAIVVHPLVFIAGAATAVWAVGMLHAVENRYIFFSDTSFGQLFWGDGNDDDNFDDADRTDKDSSPPVKTDSSHEHGAQENVQDSQERKETLCQPNEETLDQISTLECPVQVQEEKIVDNVTVVSQMEAERSRVSVGHNNTSCRDERSAISSTSKSTRLSTRSRNSRNQNILSKPKISSIPTQPTPPPTTNMSQKKEPSLPSDYLFKRYFPPLKTVIASDVSFPGLHAAEFFKVYFSNGAPYSMKQFQENRGDIDVVYGDWKALPKSVPSSFHANAQKVKELPPISDTSVRERTLSFKTLTKSYLGSVYASVTKTQRVTKVSKKLLIIENRTSLHDIPYADRFHVLERWVVRAVKHDDNADDDASAIPIHYTSKLSVYIQVVMVKSCSWESIIRKKTQTTAKELVSDWCDKATKALELTEQKKLERIRMEQRTDSRNSSLGSLRSPIVSRNGSEGSRRSVSSVTTTASEHSNPENDGSEAISTSPVDHEESSKCTEEQQQQQEEQSSTTNTERRELQLMAIHVQRLKGLEEKIAAGDLEWCSVEVRHSLAAGKPLAFAEVLTP